MLIILSYSKVRYDRYCPYNAVSAGKSSLVTMYNNWRRKLNIKPYLQYGSSCQYIRTLQLCEYAPAEPSKLFVAVDTELSKKRNGRLKDSRDVLDEILDFTESVSEGFHTYSFVSKLSP